MFTTFMDALERLAPMLPPAHYKIVGQIPLEHRREVSDRLMAIRGKIAPSTVESMGYVRDLELLVRNSDGAIAAGRSALECMALGRPVVLMGEKGILGLCKPELWRLALQSNMGDHLDTHHFDISKLDRGLREILSLRTEHQELSRQSRLFVEKYYDLRQVASDVEAIYQKAINACTSRS